MGYPVALRDELFRAFASALASPASNDDGFAAVEARHPDQGPYLKDRLPRYRKVLKAWRGRAPAEGALESHLRLGQALFNAGLFFDCHEYLEGPWKTAAGDDKRLLQGLIQLGAALHKLEQDPAASQGALESVDRALAKLEAGLNVINADPRGLKPVREIRRRLVEGRLDLGKIPELKLL